MSGPLGRERILELFDELSEELRFSRTRAHVYVVRGCGDELGVRPGANDKGCGCADRLGAPSPLAGGARGRAKARAAGHLVENEQATAWMPRADDTRAQTLYESPYLTVTGASASHLLAMKLRSARERDWEDVALLCKHLKLRGPEEAIRIFRQVFPGESVPPRALALMDRAFQDRGVSFDRLGSRRQHAGD